MIIPVNAFGESYDVTLERGALADAADILSLDRQVFILTDSGVPAQYAEKIASQCGRAHIKRIRLGEKSKCFEVLRSILSDMLSCGLGRDDCLVAVGGGVVGDMGGFAASAYMRGIDFYNVPTTLLAQVDSSIGGKTGINLDGVKNIVGAFYQPKAVLIDPDTLDTLSARYISEGLAEAIKMAVTSDEALFELIETCGDLKSALPTIIERALRIKAAVVEQDPYEKNVRRVLNFGHTVGHAIESVNLGRLLHGECVALGMLPMCSEQVRKRLVPILTKFGLPTEITDPADKLIPFIERDKKRSGSGIKAVFSDEIGSYEIKKVTPEEIEKRLEMIK